MKRFLITTAEPKSWVKDKPVLFLGKWCCLYDRQEQWRGLNAEFVRYHWDDREKYYQDYFYLQTLYEQTLRRLSDALNNFHRVDYSLRYWRILIGPWLYMFVHTLFDRWMVVQWASRNHDIDQTIILNYPAEDMIPADLKAVNPDSAEWNHFLFGKAIKYQKKINWIEKALPQQETLRQHTGASAARAGRRGLPSRVISLAGSMLANFTKQDEALVISSGLPRFEEIKLQIALGQVPKLWRAPVLEAVAPDMLRREALKIASDSQDDFHAFVYSMIPAQIPTVYLEGYAKLKQAVERLPWPAKPKVIFTSNLFQFAEVFQAWAAGKTEAGFPLVIGQHGGLYGVGKWVGGEDHQVKISDRFLTWGWRDERAQTYPALALTNVGKPEITWDPKGMLLLVTVPVRVMSYKSMSWPVGANQSDRFIKAQLGFAELLTEQMRAALVVRIHVHLDKKMKAFFANQWSDSFPDVSLDYSTQPMEQQLRKTRLFVYTYNSTGYLETMARNIPTLVFWDPTLFEFRAAAQPYFDKLKAVGIFHETPESAAAQVLHIWDDVASWWSQPDVQEARRFFCAHFARMPEKPIMVLKEALTAVPTGSNN